MILVRTIQSREDPSWVRQLNTDPDVYVPLPVTPTQSFSKVAVVHQNDVYLFEIDRYEDGQGAPVMCGSQADQPVVDVKRVFVRPGSGVVYLRRDTYRGFQGIRYASDIGDLTTGSPQAI